MVESLPRLVRPMMAVLRHEPPAEGERWGWELKWDGVRAVAYVEGSSVRLMSRNDKDMRHTYPELAVLGEMLEVPVVLDGEIVALRPDERPSFSLLQRRMHVQRPTTRLLNHVPVHYYVFDLLHQDDRPLLGAPYIERRALLEELGLDQGRVRTPPWWRDDVEQVMTFSLAHGLEGIVGKPLGSTYRPGQRGPWIKIKHSRHQEAVIAGWTPGAGRRSTMIGSLILGIYEDHGLTYIGNVGTGFTDEALRTLAKRLEPLHRPDNPFDTSLPHQIERTAHWVEPELVGEVAYTEWTPDGHLRHPSWRGLRPDKRPEQIHRELARNSVDRPEVEHPGDDAASHPNPPRNRTAEIPTRMRSRASA